jgi:hypothetical protein
MSICYELDSVVGHLLPQETVRHQCRHSGPLESLGPCRACAVALQGQLVRSRSSNRREHSDLLTRSCNWRLSAAIRNTPILVAGPSATGVEWPDGPQSGRRQAVSACIGPRRSCVGMRNGRIGLLESQGIWHELRKDRLIRSASRRKR